MESGFLSAMRSARNTAEPISVIAEKADQGERVIVTVMDHGNPKDIRAKAYEFCASGADVTLDGQALAGEFVASWVGQPILKSGRRLEFSEKIPANDPVVGISLTRGCESHWFAAIRTKDAGVVALAKAGRIIAQTGDDQ